MNYHEYFQKIMQSNSPRDELFFIKYFDAVNNVPGVLKNVEGEVVLFTRVDAEQFVKDLSTAKGLAAYYVPFDALHE